MASENLWIFSEGTEKKLISQNAFSHLPTPCPIAAYHPVLELHDNSCHLSVLESLWATL